MSVDPDGDARAKGGKERNGKVLSRFVVAVGFLEPAPARIKDSGVKTTDVKMNDVNMNDVMMGEIDIEIRRLKPPRQGNGNEKVIHCIASQFQ